MILNKTRANTLLWKIFIKNYTHFYKGLKYCKFTQKRNNAKHMKKKTILTGNITMYIKYKHKNTMKCWKTVSLKPSFGLTAEIWSQFSRLVLTEYIAKFLPASFWKRIGTWQTWHTYAWK